MMIGTQFDLFGTFADGEEARQATAARGRMRGMIERLRGTEAPLWRDEAAVILDDGAFQRAMRLVPAEEAAALWIEFDREMERVYAIWARERGLGGRAVEPPALP